MEKFVIGLVGGKGAGKDTIADLLPHLIGYDVLKLSFGQFLIEDVCQPLGIEPTNEALQLLGNMARPEWFHERARAKIENCRETFFFVIPSIRRQANVDFLRGFEPNLLIAIETDPRLCFERMKARQEKPGEERLTWEQFTAIRQAPVEGKVEAIMRQADLVFNNNGSVEDLRAQLADILPRILV